MQVDRIMAANDISRECPEPEAGSPIPPFILGTVIGGLTGAVLGTALSPHTRGFFIGLYHLLNRRLSAAERDQLRFELLLQ
ncbi:MAG: hypothetical protein IT338_12330 [Thermomicrobiales bacterium]|nr:hypothetical protein [Thermomicrobiales bacterium]